MSFVRLANKSPLLYAPSTLSATVCANAASATMLGVAVRSATQSRNELDLNPCDGDIVAAHAL